MVGRISGRSLDRSSNLKHDASFEVSLSPTSTSLTHKSPDVSLDVAIHPTCLCLTQHGIAVVSLVQADAFVHSNLNSTRTDAILPCRNRQYCGEISEQCDECKSCDIPVHRPGKAPTPSIIQYSNTCGATSVGGPVSGQAEPQNSPKLALLAGVPLRLDHNRCIAC